ETLAIGALRTETIEVAQVKNWKAILESPHMATEKNALYTAIDVRLSFKNQTETGIFKPLKVSVSEKKTETVSDDIGFKAPSLYDAPQFMKKALPITAAEIGTAMHTILEKIDINMQPEHQVISNYIETLVSKRFLTEADVPHIDHTKILNYLNSNLVQRIRMAHAVYRETPFVLKMEDQYVQGIIDLYLEESDGLILVDYKTDKIGRESVVEIAERYRGQLTIYEQALTRLTGKRIKEKAIYFLDNDTLFPM
ncbi:MAG TPA: PD-(D/E)XK nuclease family protein, partial [Fusibacter sp.]|nr:PD-(D/E)XK nuclease family protein [Fusibacter sp.]